MVMSKPIRDPINHPIVETSKASLEHVHLFDGVDDYLLLGYRLINVEGDIDISFRTGDTVPRPGIARCIIDQSNNNNFNFKEFYLQVNSSGFLQMMIGGTFFSSFDTVPGLEQNTSYRVLLQGAVLKYFRNGVMLKEIPGIVRGTAREALAPTKVGAWGLLASTGGHYLGELYDIKINGINVPINNRNDQIVCPGLESMPIIFDKNHTPTLIGTQWQDLGSGKWQLIGDGSYNSLRLLNSAQHPVAGIVEFEVESISGQMRASSGGVPSSAYGIQFSTPGLKRYFYTAYSAEAIVEFSRNNAGIPASCVLKNITFRPLVLADSPELVINGTFANGTNNWNTTGSGSMSVTAGRATLTTVASQSSRFEQQITLEPDSWYLAVADLISLSGNTNARLNIIRGLAGNYLWVANSTLAAPGKLVAIFKAAHSDIILQIVGDGINAGTVEVDNVSLKKITQMVHPQILMNATSVGWKERPLQNKPLGFFSLRNSDFSKPSNSVYLGFI